MQGSSYNVGTMVRCDNTPMHFNCRHTSTQVSYDNHNTVTLKVFTFFIEGNTRSTYK